ncbi:rrna-processing protein fcf2 [Diaporthe amygdali]|uniref:rrna-processing protein fcf2 n=1 Tax=Phomopsis amygdali TaxID=1214568 RepID=UPI0022FE5003|nr:rrna-processing protein fcf2 [Diaporthe amygdali]KAJ0116418.1 rrna-processing protein fcf2 [Diaporthe amygdali]
MAVVDLSDHDIDQLLSSAELSLASKPTDQAVATKDSQQSLTLAPKAPAATGLVGKVGKEAGNKQPELALRVPQLKSKDKKAVPDNAGAAWNYMPRTQIDDPKVKREFQLLRMRGIVDRKKFFKKDSRKDPFPTFSQFGTLIEGPLEHHNGRLTRKERKRTLVEEVLATGEADGKFKDRYEKIQEKKMSGKKGYYKKLMAARRKGR